MLAIARALMSRPQLLLLDEPSLGLAPLYIKKIFQIVRELNREHGMTILLVEQNAHHALRVAHRGYVCSTARSFSPAPAANCWPTRRCTPPTSKAVTPRRPA
jgi:ABC-type branched-subunit amino acid transport system ATPase component